MKHFWAITAGNNKRWGLVALGKSFDVLFDVFYASFFLHYPIFGSISFVPGPFKAYGYSVFIIFLTIRFALTAIFIRLQKDGSMNVFSTLLCLKYSRPLCLSPLLRSTFTFNFDLHFKPKWSWQTQAIVVLKSMVFIKSIAAYFCGGLLRFEKKSKTDLGIFSCKLHCLCVGHMGAFFEHRPPP